MLLGVLFAACNADAVCVGTPLNPITEVCWQCILPIKIAGQVVIPGADLDTVDLSNAPICVCPAPPPIFWRIGLTLSFWEPARFAEVVHTPFCFPSIGMGFSNPAMGTLAGANAAISSFGATDTPKLHSFYQSHWFIFPVWGVMELLTDFSCIELGGIDVAYLTEVDPLWNDDLLSSIITPEALLFANPIAQMSCIADAPLALIGGPAMSASNVLFWCMGSWGSAYPLTGNVGDPDLIQASGGVAARTIYKLCREFLIWDTAVALCAAVPTPIWIKANYKMHLAKPMRDFFCHPIGRTSLLWEYVKNPPFRAGGNKSDEFLWMIFRKRACCAL